MIIYFFFYQTAVAFPACVLEHANGSKVAYSLTDLLFLLLPGGVAAADSGRRPQCSGQLELHAPARGRHQGQDRRLYR